MFGGDSLSTEIWWWENPFPATGTLWERHLIKTGGGTQHHDLMFGDVDDDGVAEFVYWNQKPRPGDRLFVAEIPADPTAGPWPATEIFSAANPSEGMAIADIDLDGIDDIVGAGYWFKYQPTSDAYLPQPIDPDLAFTRTAVGQLIPGGRPEVVVDSGDAIGPLIMFEWDGAEWVSRDLLGINSEYGHSLQLGDVDGDGHLDIMSAEMVLNGNDDAPLRVLYGDGTGAFLDVTIVAVGIDNHESLLADLDADGDLDILGKPFIDGTPAINIWRNDGLSPFDNWVTCRGRAPAPVRSTVHRFGRHRRRRRHRPRHRRAGGSNRSPEDGRVTTSVRLSRR